MRIYCIIVAVGVVIACVAVAYAFMVFSPPLGEGSTWSPVIEVTPSTPSVGDLVRIYVKLVYTGSREVLVNPFKLRSMYSVNLTIVNLKKKSVYLSRLLGYKGVGSDERTITIKPGDSLGIGYTEVVFVRPGSYLIKAHISGSGLAISKNEVTFELKVKPKTLRISYVNTSEVNDWMLTLKVKPEDPTVNDNLTLEVLLRYVGSSEFKVEAAVPLIKSIEITHIRGVDSWGIAIPSHISYIDVKPGYQQSFTFIVGPKAPFPHRFVAGVYKVEVRATGYTPKGYPVDITVTLFIRVREG